MMKKLLVASAATLLAATAGTASAGGPNDSIGVGVEAQINGAGGLSVNYQIPKMHFGAFLGIQDGPNDDDTAYQLGGRFFYHIHETGTSDFGVGGSLGFNEQPDGMGGHANLVFIEPSFQIRAWVASNVALSFTGGIVIGASDANGVSVGGQLDGFAGIHYYFN